MSFVFQGEGSLGRSCLISLGVGHGVVGFSPGVDATLDGCDVFPSGIDVLDRHTGGRVFLRSPAVKDQTGVFGQVVLFLLELF